MVAYIDTVSGLPQVAISLPLPDRQCNLPCTVDEPNNLLATKIAACEKPKRNSYLTFQDVNATFRIRQKKSMVLNEFCYVLFADLLSPI